MAVPTPESLAMNCEMKCDMCKESVNYGDDYQTHLQFAHNVTNNFHFFMQKALEKIKGETRKAADIVTLDEEVSSANEKPVSRNLKVLDNKTKETIEKVVEKTMDELFAPIKCLLEGKEPLELFDDDVGENTIGDDYDHCAADEKIWQSFEKLKEIVNTMEFPIDLLHQLSSPDSRPKASVNLQEATLDELDSPLPIVNKESAVKKFKKPQTKRRAESPLSKESSTSVADREPRSSSITPVKKPSPALQSPKHQVHNLNLQGKLAPVRSDRSDTSSTSEAGKFQTYFICPLETCGFYTSKQGMKEGKAASHLKEAHKILTGEDMRRACPGGIKFKKVKGEPTV